MARTAICTDTFNRASLGTEWLQLNENQWGPMSINGSARISVSAAAAQSNTHGAAIRCNFSGALDSGQTGDSANFIADQYSSLVLAGTLNNLGDAAYNVGVIVRASTDIDGARDFYGVTVGCLDAGGGTFRTILFKIVNGVYSPLGTGDVAFIVTDRLELEAEGTTIRVMKNGTALGGSFTVTDSSLASGNPGVCGGSSNYIMGDDWEGGNLTSSSAITGRSLLLGIG
jgi:hypothetical protein